MKKITMSIVSVLALSGVAVAGGDIAPVAPVIAPAGEFYVGAAYSAMNMDRSSSTIREIDDCVRDCGQYPDTIIPGGDASGDAITVLAGYNYNDYIALEGRYTTTLQADDVDEMTNIGLYLKPMYPVGQFNLYGLLGFGQVTVDDGSADYSESGFQWGLGGSFSVTENIGLFVDYTSLYDDDGFDGLPGDTEIDSINMGVTYTF